MNFIKHICGYLNMSFTVGKNFWEKMKGIQNYFRLIKKKEHSLTNDCDK